MPHLATFPDPRPARPLTDARHAPSAATRYIGGMKPASLPAVPVEPALRADLEAALEQGESIEEFIEGAVAERVRRRKEARAEFLARGQASFENWKRTGVSFTWEEVECELRRKLELAEQRLAAKRASPR